MAVYSMIRDFCNEMVAEWHQYQRVNLMLTMYALFVRKSLVLSHLAQHFPLPAQAKVRTRLLVVWKRGYAEPWLLATSLTDPKLVFSLYRSRMKIEHGFRDWKTHLRLKHTLHAQNVAYVKGLMTVLALLYWFISLPAGSYMLPANQPADDPMLDDNSSNMWSAEHTISTRPLAPS